MRTQYLGHGHFSIKWQLLDLEGRINVEIQRPKPNYEIRLPPEIFVKVLEARVLEEDVLTATLVCRRWNAMAMSARCLWTRIDLGKPRRAELYLNRSGESPIDVTVNNFAVYTLGSLGETPPWVARMKSLLIDNVDNERIEGILSHFCEATPQLQSLIIDGIPGISLTGDPIHDFPVPHGFLGRHAPLLQSLKFKSVSPREVFTFPLPRLTHIDWIAEKAPVAINGLLQLFASSPQLEFIKIHALVRRQEHLRLETVSLNKLRELDWADTEGSISLIPWLIAPKLSRLNIRIIPSRQHQLTTLSSILHLDRDRIPLLLEPKEVEYVYEPSSRSCFFGYREPTAYIRVSEVTTGDGGTNPAISGWFSSNLPISFSKTEKLSVETTDGPQLFGFPIEQFEGLRELHLKGQIDLLAGILNVNRDRDEPIPCTELSKICASPTLSGSALIGLREVLKERKEAGHVMKTVQWDHGCTDTEIGGLREFVEEVIELY